MKFEMDDIYDQISCWDETFQLKLNKYKLFPMLILSYTNLYLKWHSKFFLWNFIPQISLSLFSRTHNIRHMMHDKDKNGYAMVPNMLMILILIVHIYIKANNYLNSFCVNQSVHGTNHLGPYTSFSILQLESNCILSQIPLPMYNLQLGPQINFPSTICSVLHFIPTPSWKMNEIFCLATIHHIYNLI
jgi:hypothetical protein